MESIEIRTLIDITKPLKVMRSGQGNPLEQLQYKNWITLQQCIGLRSITMYDSSPQVEMVDVTGTGFGSKHNGIQRVWTFVFYTDRTRPYETDDGNLVGLLLPDLHLVPIISKLSETVDLQTPVIDLHSEEWKNTVVTASIDLIGD